MNRLLKRVLIISLVLIPAISILFFIDSKQQNYKDIRDSEKQEEKVNSGEPFVDFRDDTLIGRTDSSDSSCSNCGTQLELSQILKVKQTAWIPPWDYKNGIESFKRFESQFHSISPVTFQINNDGTLTQRIDPNLKDLKEIAIQKNTKLIPSIGNFDSNLMKNIFDSPDNTQRHIQSIVQTVQTYEYDGIDLDYESIQPSNKDAFLDFVKKLSIELKKNNKILSVTVMSKWGDDVMYTGSPGTRAVQDWTIIGQWADEVRIMAYDFTPLSSSKEGPIAPIGWVERVLQYAVEKIPPEKVWLGVPLYSYEWVMPTKDSEEVKIRTNSYTYNVVKSKILVHDYVDIKYDEEYQEGYAEYKCLENYFCIIFYSTPESVKARKGLAEKYNIAGVAYWRLGGEDELID